MKAIATIDASEDRATVVLTPCWLARLFGAVRVQVELEHRVIYGWVTRIGLQRLSKIRHGRKILRALDFRPIAPLPQAMARDRK